MTEKHQILHKNTCIFGAGQGVEKMGMLKVEFGGYKLHGVVNRTGKNVAVFRHKVTYQHNIQNV